MYFRKSYHAVCFPELLTGSLSPYYYKYIGPKYTQNFCVHHEPWVLAWRSSGVVDVLILNMAEQLMQPWLLLSLTSATVGKTTLHCPFVAFRADFSCLVCPQMLISLLESPFLLLKSLRFALTTENGLIFQNRLPLSYRPFVSYQFFVPLIVFLFHSKFIVSKRSYVSYCNILVIQRKFKFVSIRHYSVKLIDDIARYFGPIGP